MICDENVFTITENNTTKKLQTLPKESEFLSMLAVGSDVLLIGFPNYVYLTQYYFKDGLYEKFFKVSIEKNWQRLLK